MASSTALLTEVLKEAQTNGRGNADSDNERASAEAQSGFKVRSNKCDHKTSFVQSSDTQTPKTPSQQWAVPNTQTLSDYFSYLLVFYLCFEWVQQMKTYNHPSWFNKAAFLNVFSVAVMFKKQLKSNFYNFVFFPFSTTDLTDSFR